MTELAAKDEDSIRLVFFCCHPELSVALQVALALRLVWGFSPARIASALLVEELVVADQLRDALTLVADGEVSSSLPDDRLDAVTLVLYLLFNEGYSASGASALCDEAIRLARILAGVFDDEREVAALLALFLLQHSRASARFDEGGGAILLDDQDRTRWDRRSIDEGLELLERAQRGGTPDLFQLQAAIAAEHARATLASDTDWPAIEALYAELEALQPSPVITLNRAVAVWKVHGAETALAMIEPLARRLGAYFHFYGLRAELLVELGRGAEAREAFAHALRLARTPAETDHVRAQLERLSA